MKRNWKHERLEDVFVLQMGKTPARQIDRYWNNGTNKWVSIADIGKCSTYIENTKEQITDEAILESGIRQVPANTLIMSFKLSLGKVAITREPLYTNEAIMAFVDRGKYQLSLSFLFHLFKNKDWSDGTNKAVMGITLNKATMKDIVIPIPPLQEQEQIAKNLDAIYSLISTREEQLRKLDCLASSRFVEMFGDPISNPKGWTVKTIRDVVANQKNALKAGPFGSSLKKEFYCSSGYKIYGQEQVIGGSIEIGDYYISKEKYDELKSCAVQAQDVLISLVGTYGKTLVIPEVFYPGIINPRLIKISFDLSIINVKYFQAFFSSEALKVFLDNQTHGCTMGVLNLGIIAALKIPVPPMSLQNEYAAFIEQLDKSKVVGKMQRISLENNGSQRYIIVEALCAMKDIEAICTVFEGTEANKDSASVALTCRNCVLDAVKLIFEDRKVKFPESASMLELLDSPVITGFINDPEIMNSLQFIRILGINAQHGLPVKKTEAKLARDNTAFFLGFIRNKFLPALHEVEYEKLPYMTEAATRKLYIDLYLREAGWEVLNVEGMVVPGKAGIEIQVEGMPNTAGIGFCDYVLYGKDGKPLAIVEAKKTSVSPEVGRHQVMLYGDCMEKQYGYRPVLYYTNGYEINCIDGLYPDRQLYAYHTLAELELLIQRRSRKDITDLRIREDITNRPYQTMAITKLCERLNQKFRRGLLVMATGTGKTRVAISLVDVLSRNQWIKNVLFLADRTSLVAQAHKSFSKLLPDQSYCVLSDRSLNGDMNARIMLSTYQTMINYVDGEEKKFSVGRFDLIIVDEAHRSIFNKYGAIFDYFDSLLVGLTATPKSEVDANTYRIFKCESGEPNFDYSLKEAVAEHYLVPYKVVNRTTRILQRGIKYADLSPEEKKQIEEAFADDPPEMGYDVESSKIFRTVYNETTCDRVLQELMEQGLKIESGDKLGKTIIFAYNHKHAELIVKRFKELYPSYGANYCQLIDNTVAYANDLILKFESDPDFQIAVSVDMLDTGIDVPAVVNLVFFKPVKSKIKFIQMIGRGTRLCENLFGPDKNKEYFLIFDYCGNFEYFGEHPDSIDPVGSITITQRLFNIRLAILVELQKIEHQEVEFNRCYHKKLLEQLHHEIVKIRANSCRIQVRQEMPYVDKYYDLEIWSNLNELNQKEIQNHLSYLLDAESNEPENVKIFDARMLSIEISLLLTGKTTKARKDVEVVRKVGQYLLEKASVPQIMAKADQLKMLVSEQFWVSPTVEKLELLREDIRDLMQFITTTGGKIVILHIEDEAESGGPLDGDLIDIRTYRQKVMDYLKEHSDSPVIQKIHKLEKINGDDLKELENILWHQLGTQEEYDEEAKNKTLAVFIRSLIGLDQDAVNQKFGEFLNGNVLNAQQQEFVKDIIAYVQKNGNISKEDLLQEDPFAEFDVATLFGEKISVVLDVINTVRGAVEAA